MTTFSRLVTISACCALSGCTAIPSAFDLVSWSTTAFSYAISGKSPSDHLLSEVVEKDCVVSNVAFGKKMCVDPDHIPAAQGSQGLSFVHVLGMGNGNSNGSTSQFRSEPAIDAAHDAEIHGAKRAYAVIGSFERVINAHAFSIAYADYRAVVATSYVAGAERFRVVVGPLGDQGTSRLEASLVPGGLPNHWLLWLCTGDLTPPPCKSS